MRIKPIPAYPGYFVSDDGKVFSTKRYAEMVERKPFQNGKYLHVILYEPDWSKKHLCAIHRLVLMAFVGPCPSGMHGCHNDGNALNNNLDNLRWDTPSANTQDKWRHGTMAHGEDAGLAKLTETEVLEIRSMAGRVSHRKIAALYGVTKSAISSILWRHTWTHI